MGLTLASWRVGAWALLGAFGAALSGMAAQADPDSLSGGLLGYSAVLVAIAIGVTFRADRPLWWRLLVIALGVIATIALRTLMASTPVPVDTGPFVLVTWVLLAVSSRNH